MPNAKPHLASLKAGHAHRRSCPRATLGHWDVSRRKQEPSELLRHAMAGRLKSLAGLKLQRMSATAFGFFRGAAPVMAYDLSLMPNTGIVTQICGDAHAQNLGAYAGPDGRLIFDINDFDESIRGPFEWDVKRMATSLLLAARDARLRRTAAAAAAYTFLDAYTALLRQLARMPILEAARYQVHRIEQVAPISAILRNAERSTPLHSLDRLTEPTVKGRRFKSDPPCLRRITGADAEAVLASLVPFAQTILPARRHFLAQYRPLDVAFKVVGTGSVGLRDYCVYMEGNGPKDPLFLQIKEEAASCYAPYLAPPAETTRENQGQRVVDGQIAMQLQSDPFLGWTTLDGRDFLIRQLNDHKASIDITALKPADLCAYAHVCGEILARGHARSGDARLIAGYIGAGKRFTEAVLRFAQSYAVQTVADWKHLLKQNESTAKPV